MRFLMSVIDSATGTASSDEMAAIDEFNEMLVAEGHWVLAGGLQPPASSAVIDNRGGAGVLTDGPLVPGPEYLSGFWVIQAPDASVARRLATEASRACNRRVELRGFLG